MTLRKAKAEHGTRSKYEAGCRCNGCTVANREAKRIPMRNWMREDFLRIRAEGRKPPSHGTTRAYRYYGCRCRACVKVTRDYQREYLRKISQGGESRV